MDYAIFRRISWVNHMAFLRVLYIEWTEVSGARHTRGLGSIRGRSERPERKFLVAKAERRLLRDQYDYTIETA